MTIQNFKKLRVAVAFVLGMTISFLVQTNHYYSALIMALMAFLFLYVIKKQVVGIVEDERDLAVAGHAARYSITVYVVFACVAFFVFYANRAYNSHYEAIASTLAYSSCAILLIYSLYFRFYEQISRWQKRPQFLFLMLAAVCLIFVGAARLLGGEDAWICQDGIWQKHGNPSEAQPSVVCPL